MFDDLTEEDWLALREPLQEEWPALTDEELDDMPREWAVLVDRIVDLHEEPEDEVEEMLRQIVEQTLGDEALAEAEEEEQVPEWDPWDEEEDEEEEEWDEEE